MTMSVSRKQIWLAVLVVPPALVFTFVMGLFAYMTATMTPLHPNAQDVSSVTHSAPVPQWASAVAEARKAVRASLTEKNLPGLSVAVGAGGGIVWAEGFGWADLEERVPVAPETLFRIGTASTALTSVAVGLLLEHDRLKLDEKIQTYVDDVPEKQSPVTLRQLLGHTAGVPSDGGDEGPLFTEHCEHPAEAQQFFRGSERELRFEPGTKYRYSNYGFILVSAAIETAAHEPFLTFMRTQVFEPLGLDHTMADSATESIPNRATFYFPKFAAEPRYGPDQMRPLDYSCYAGSSVFLSTPSDLVRFAMAIDSGKLLQPATVRMFQTSQHLASGKETGYGLGWDLETVALSGKHTTVVGHNGDSLGGMVASLWMFPEHGIVVSVIANESYADTFGIGVKIAQAFVEHAPPR
jgi:serine beta-lactamase-like protein LACTB